MMALLDADLHLSRPPLDLRATFSLSAPWTCLFGPSGSGKSTVLRALAGLTRPDTGRIVLGSDVLFDAPTRLHVRPYLRPIRMAAQRSMIFPGTVRANILYGVRRGSEGAAEKVLDHLDLRALAGTTAARLSGGEQQRVAIARAMAAAAYGSQPARLLLLDEPFNGMDAARRDALALGLRDWLGELRIPVLSVTHDVGEVFLLGAEVIRMAEGRIVARGAAAEVLTWERSRLLVTLTSHA